MSRTSVGWRIAGRRTAGLVFLLVFALLVWLSVALYDKRFTPVALVTLRADTVGDELHRHAEVKLRGVVVGEVRTISSTGGGADLSLAIEPDMVPLLPANVTAELLPTSLFGERYVDLVLPPRPVAARLVAGSVIGQDRSGSAIELQQVFGDLLPMLQAIQPQKLSVTLTALAQALDGRGDELGDTLVRLNTYLKRIGTTLPALDRDISRFASVANSYDTAAPDIVTALSDFTVTTRTIAAQRDQLAALFTSVTGAAADARGFLRANGDTLIRLSTDSRSTLRLLARYSPEFPCVLEQLTAFEPAMDAALGKGTAQPGLHITLHAVRSLGRYTPGTDRPVYRDDTGPRCFATTTSAGTAGRSGTATTPIAALLAAPGVGASPQQDELVTELAAAGAGVAPAALPGWTGALLGPLYRGTEVTVG
jgi:phospholipid/cholesterol/gamma-HCH transport system substrate-binding protein